ARPATAAAGQTPPGARPSRGGRPCAGRACFRAAIRVGRARRPVTGVPEEWPSPTLAGGDRTRLTGRLALLFGDFPFLTDQEHSRKHELTRNDINAYGCSSSTNRCFGRCQTIAQRSSG